MHLRIINRIEIIFLQFNSADLASQPSNRYKVIAICHYYEHFHGVCSDKLSFLINQRNEFKRSHSWAIMCPNLLELLNVTVRSVRIVPSYALFVCGITSSFLLSC